MAAIVYQIYQNVHQFYIHPRSSEMWGLYKEEKKFSHVLSEFDGENSKSVSKSSVSWVFAVTQNWLNTCPYGLSDAAWNASERSLKDGRDGSDSSESFPTSTYSLDSVGRYSCESPRTEEKEHCLDTRGGLRWNWDSSQPCARTKITHTCSTFGIKIFQ